MALTSASTLTQVQAAYRDNAGYDTGTGSAAQCDAFAEACRHLVERYSASMASGGKSRTRDLQRIENALQRALDWKKAHGGVMFTRGRPVV